MKRFWKIAGIATVVALLGVVVIGAVAFAQDGEDGKDWPFNFRERMHEAIARNLGISVEEYDAAVETAQQEVIDEAVAEGWLTEDQAERMRERMEEGDMPWIKGRNSRFVRRAAGHSITTVAETLDMTPQELLAELRDGRSIAEIAAEQGVDTQTIVDALMDQLREKLDEAVANGRLTQERADWILSQAETRITDMLNRTWGDHMPGGRFDGFRRPGMRPGGHFQGPHGQFDD